MSNPDITEAPEETPYMGMTEEEKGIQFAQDEERRAVMRVMFASVFGEEEVMKDDVKRTLDMMGIEEDDMSDLQDIGDAMMENIEAAETDEEMEAIMYAAADRYLKTWKA